MRILHSQILAALVLVTLLCGALPATRCAASAQTTSSSPVFRPGARPNSGEPDGHSTVQDPDPSHAPHQASGQITIPDLGGVGSVDEAMRILREWLIQLFGRRPH